MTEEQKEFAAKLADIRLSYVTDALPQQIQAVCACADSFTAAINGDDAVVALTKLHAASHKLAGSSGTFGFWDISAAARRLSEFTDANGLVGAANFSEYKPMIRQMAEEVFKAADTPDVSV
jgi:HPt (histidine-containing phosphotransfer) domain-containing protein